MDLLQSRIGRGAPSGPSVDPYNCDGEDKARGTQHSCTKLETQFTANSMVYQCAIAFLVFAALVNAITMKIAGEDRGKNNIPNCNRYLFLSLWNTGVSRLDRSVQTIFIFSPALFCCLPCLAKDEPFNAKEISNNFACCVGNSPPCAVAISGLAGVQAAMNGIYDPTAEMINGGLVYKARHGDYILQYSTNTKNWMVSLLSNKGTDMGCACIAAPDPSQPIERATATWEVWNNTDKKWEAKAEVKVCRVRLVLTMEKFLDLSRLQFWFDRKNSLSLRSLIWPLYIPHLVLSLFLWLLDGVLNFVWGTIALLTFCSINTGLGVLAMTNGELNYHLYGNEGDEYPMTVIALLLEDVPQFLIQLGYAVVMSSRFDQGVSPLQWISFSFTVWRFTSAIAYKTGSLVEGEGSNKKPLLEYLFDSTGITIDLGVAAAMPV